MGEISEIVAFSYIRFSSRRQELGDSQRRQFDGALKWCKKHEVPLDSRTWSDLGVSAWKGKNFHEGALGAFLEFAKSGRCPKGCYLIVESVDRLSRQVARKALRILEEIVEAGVRVVSLKPERVWDEASLDEPFGLVEFLIIASRAHEESQIKSMRVRDAWAKAIANGKNKIITSRVPGWLTVTDGKIVAIPERAKLIRQIFNWSTEEGLGQRAIAKRLNGMKVPCWGVPRKPKNHSQGEKGTPHNWGWSYVRLILVDRRVCGTFTSDSTEGVIADYYPRIISDEQFAKVRSLTDQRVRFRGADSGKISNLFTGLAFDSRSGASMVYVSKRSTTPPRFVSSDFEVGRAKGAQSFRYDLFEENFLEPVSEPS